LPRGNLQILARDRTLVRLGKGGLANGALTADAARRALAVLRPYATRLHRSRVDRIEAVATSAVREASNGPGFVRMVRARLGLPLRIISGEEEARLTLEGVLATQRVRHPALMIAIGGGSAQVAYGTRQGVSWCASLPLGGDRLAQRFLHHDPPRPEEVEALRGDVRCAWAPVAKALRRFRWRAALGSSALIAQLMAAASTRSRGQRPIPRQLSITQRSLRELVKWLSRSTSADRVRRRGVDPGRQEQLLSVGVVLLAWMERCGVSRLRHAAGSLREGLVAEVGGSRKRTDGTPHRR